MRRGRWLRAAGCVVLLILTLALTVYGASEGSSVTAVKLVRDTEGYHLDITAALSSQDADVLRGETVYLFELFPYQNTASLGGMLPVASADASSRSTSSPGSLMRRALCMAVSPSTMSPVSATMSAPTEFASSTTRRT